MQKRKEKKDYNNVWEKKLYSKHITFEILQISLLYFNSTKEELGYHCSNSMQSKMQSRWYSGSAFAFELSSLGWIRDPTINRKIGALQPGRGITTWALSAMDVKPVVLSTIFRW